MAKNAAQVKDVERLRENSGITNICITCWTIRKFPTPRTTS